MIRNISQVSLSERTPLISKPNKSGCEDAIPPNGIMSRGLALLLMSLVGFGCFFCFDNPGALQSEVKHDLRMTTSEFANLYAWYSWPNVVLPIIGGFLIDRVFGVRFGTVVFAAFILAGQVILAVGGLIGTFSVMALGRLVFGIGGESLNMALNTYTVRWFRGKELNMVFGLQLSIARVGSTVNFLLMGPLYHFLSHYVAKDSVIGWTFMAATAFTGLSFLSSLVLGWLDYRREKGGDTKEHEEEPEVSLSQVREFPATFWTLCLATLAYYGSIFPFVSLAQEFFKEQFCLSEVNANFITGLVYLVSAIASPVFGLLMDRLGRNVSWMMGAIATSALCHIMLAFFPRVSPYYSIVLMGLAYSILASALWSLPAMLLPDSQLGTAFGIMQALQNLGTGLITLGAGFIVDRYGYTWLEVFFIAWLKVALLSAGAIWIMDRRNGGILNLSTKARDILKKEDEAEKLLEEKLNTDDEGMDQICIRRSSYDSV